MSKGHIAVIDIGKTNAKLALVDLADLSEIKVITRPNTVQPGPPYPNFDVDGHWQFILEGLADFQRSFGVSAISITTHGAGAALLAADGSLAAPILDYEHTGPDSLAEAYNAIRPDFAETGSPRLGMGLNLGAQLFWQFETDPTLTDRTAKIVTYPQYWGHRLTGVAATDVTSLGCHTDLWNPHRRAFSSLVASLGLSEKIAEPRRPAEVLGNILPEIAARTGLPENTPVLCGIHDSNASLLPHLLQQKAPFAVVSTGTWVIAMSVGGPQTALDPEADTLVNVNALGDPVPSARFMGGREFDIAAGKNCPDPSEADLMDVLTEGVMLLPAVVPQSGPFRGRHVRWIGPEPEEGSPRRKAAVSLYLALVTAHCLSAIGRGGPIIVEGPFAANAVYTRMLSAITNAPIIASQSTTGTSSGAAMLLETSQTLDAPRAQEPPEQSGVLRRYADLWVNEATR